MSTTVQLYDDRIDFEENKVKGPFGQYADSKKYKDIGSPQYKFLGLPVFSLFGAASCPAGMNSRSLRAVFDKGFDIVTTKTRRSVAFNPNPFPQLLQLDLKGNLTDSRAARPIKAHHTDIKSLNDINLANSFGNNSESPKTWMPDLASVAESLKPGKLLIASVVGTIQPGFTPEDYHQDFAKTARMAADTGVAAIELNLSCPNVVTEGVVCYDPDVVTDICQKTRKMVGPKLKILTKLGYFTAAQQSLLETTIKRVSGFVDGISAINTIPATIVTSDGTQAFPGDGRKQAGVSGSSVKWAGLDMTKRLDGIRKKYHFELALIGVGGVLNEIDYHDYIDAGADAVQSATGAIWNPNLAAQIKASLVR